MGVAGASVVLFAYLGLGGHRVEVLGFDLRGSLLVAAIFSLASLGYEAGKLVLCLPDASVTDDGFVVRQFPWQRSVRWDDVARIEEPAPPSARFGSSITSIVVVVFRQGGIWRFIPPCDEDTIPRFHEALVASLERSRRAIGEPSGSPGEDG